MLGCVVWVRFVLNGGMWLSDVELLMSCSVWLCYRGCGIELFWFVLNGGMWLSLNCINPVIE